MVKTLVALLVVGVVGVSSKPQFLGVPSSTPLTYLGVPQSAPVLYNNPFTFRTAFDIFQGSYAPYYNYPVGSFLHTGAPVIYQPSTAALTPTRTVVAAPAVAAAPAADAVAVDAAVDPADTVKAVEVGVEEEVDGPAFITVKEVPASLPDIVRPFDKFRGAPAPVIPAGIAAATQPRFTQTLFQNSALAPGFRFVANSKVSSVLRGLQEDSAGIIRT